jgi:uncharacterized membrane protein
MAPIHAVAGAVDSPLHPTIQRIGLPDIVDALRKGVDDFAAMPSHAVFLCLIYPLVGFFLGGMTLGYNVLPLFYPLAAGFALLGPVAAIGLYELSRRRERGLDTRWTHAFDVFHAPSFPAIAMLSLLLTAIFLFWLLSAQLIYQSLFGVAPPRSISQFVEGVLTTKAGHSLILWGNLVGFLHAVVVLAISVVSFPLLLDRPVGAAEAIATSVRAVLRNPAPMALWGLIVAALLLLGSLPAFIGLAVVLPILGHSTWHLYRKVVMPAERR